MKGTEKLKCWNSIKETLRFKPCQQEIQRREDWPTKELIKKEKDARARTTRPTIFG